MKLGIGYLNVLVHAEDFFTFRCVSFRKGYVSFSIKSRLLDCFIPYLAIVLPRIHEFVIGFRKVTN